jgi:hypothetical protein
MGRGLTVATLVALPASGVCGKIMSEAASCSAKIWDLGVVLSLESEA